MVTSNRKEIVTSKKNEKTSKKKKRNCSFENIIFFDIYIYIITLNTAIFI